MSSGERGFTLIEIMIAMAIMAALTVFTAKSIQDALRNSAKYRRQINESSELRDVLRVMEKDVNLAFHHRNIQQEILDEIKKETKTGQSDEGANRFSSDENEKAPNYTQFKGENDSLSFSSLSNVRTIADAKESDQAEVGYYLKNCHQRDNSKVSFPCLWRRISPIIDEDLERGGVSVPILENVKSLEFRYIGDEGENDLSAEPQWQKTWDSTQGDTAGKFPDAVEIKITVNRRLGDKIVPQSLSTVAALRFPNNPQPKSEADEKVENTSN